MATTMLLPPQSQPALDRPHAPRCATAADLADPTREAILRVSLPDRIGLYHDLVKDVEQFRASNALEVLADRSDVAEREYVYAAVVRGAASTFCAFLARLKALHPGARIKSNVLPAARTYTWCAVAQPGRSAMLSALRLLKDEQISVEWTERSLRQDPDDGNCNRVHIDLVLVTPHPLSLSAVEALAVQASLQIDQRITVCTGVCLSPTPSVLPHAPTR